MKPCTSSTLTSSAHREADQRAQDQRVEHRGGQVGVEALHPAGRDHRREAHDVGHRQVQAADEDDEGLADRDQAEHAHRGEDGPDVALAEEVAALDGGQHGRDHDHADQHEVDQLGRVELLGTARSRGAPTAYGLAALHARSRVGGACRLRRPVGGGAHAASSLAAPVAMASTASSLAPAGSSPARRPSRITRIRSDMPITSGSSLETISTATPLRVSSRISS